MYVCFNFYKYGLLFVISSAWHIQHHGLVQWFTLLKNWYSQSQESRQSRTLGTLVPLIHHSWTWWKGFLIRAWFCGHICVVESWFGNPETNSPHLGPQSLWMSQMLSVSGEVVLSNEGYIYLHAFVREIRNLLPNIYHTLMEFAYLEPSSGCPLRLRETSCPFAPKHACILVYVYFEVFGMVFGQSLKHAL